MPKFEVGDIVRIIPPSDGRIVMPLIVTGPGNATGTFSAARLDGQRLPFTHIGVSGEYSRPDWLEARFDLDPFLTLARKAAKRK